LEKPAIVEDSTIWRYDAASLGYGFPWTALSSLKTSGTDFPVTQHNVLE